MTDSRFPFIAHCRASGLTLPAVTLAGDAAPGRVLRQGEEFEVTEELYEATLDRTGASWLNLTDAEQVARYGCVKWAKGPRPEGMAVGGDDEGYRYRQGQAAKAYAERISDPMDRALALKKVQVEYGDALNPIAQGPQHIPVIR
ncbi:hypothetical protein [Microbacterium sp. APC 3901]|uniref:hypothetical protein n=1 Tax=Microbacterium sp. APC 3901 TaxID=3035192 RepID=UPI0025B33335|nr:hypothetical protein [Microbacterium sp. APC 3901]MDN3443398.1 hypothetical protein [Microbacterium sp. APC 3901]